MKDRPVRFENYMIVSGIISHIFLVFYLLFNTITHFHNKFLDSEISEDKYAWCWYFDVSWSPKEVKQKLRDTLSDGKITHREYNELDSIYKTLTKKNEKESLIRRLDP